jgi:hypothetical protein
MRVIIIKIPLSGNRANAFFGLKKALSLSPNYILKWRGTSSPFMDDRIPLPLLWIYVDESGLE